MECRVCAIHGRVSFFHVVHLRRLRYFASASRLRAASGVGSIAALSIVEQVRRPLPSGDTGQPRISLVRVNSTLARGHLTP